MPRYEILIETKEPIYLHHMDLLRTGLRRYCPMDPGAEFEQGNNSHYLTFDKDHAESLVQDLSKLEYVVSTQIITPEDKN